jgi:hypothetical protein
MRIGVSLVAVAALALAAPSFAGAADVYWPVAKLMRVLDRHTVTVGGRVVRIDSETTLCAGRGTPRRVRGLRAWHTFACTYTLFTRKGVDRDLDFRVQVRDARRLAIADAHWVGETR